MAQGQYLHALQGSVAKPSESHRAEQHIKVLLIVQDADRPTLETIIGLHRNGCDVRAICPPKPAFREALGAAGVRLIDLKITKRLDVEGIRRLRRELIDGRYDILHAFGSRGLQNGIVALRALPTRLVAYRGRVGNVSFFDPFSWLRHLSPRIDRLICVSDAVRDYFLHMRPSFLRAPAGKFVRIYKGHDLAWYTDAPAELSQLGIPEHAFVVSCVANYRPHKGIDHLIGALAHLPHEIPVHLMLVGNMNAARLDRVIGASPLRDRIHRVGYRTDAPALAAASDVFVLPSTIPEGLPRSAIEAMAYGRACIVTGFGGAAELVVDGVSGLHVPPGDPAAIARAVCRLYHDPGLRQRIGRAAKERVAACFNIAATIEQTLDVYRDLLREGRAAHRART